MLGRKIVSPALWDENGMNILNIIFAVERGQRNAKNSTGIDGSKAAERRRFLGASLQLLSDAVEPHKLMSFLEQSSPVPRRTAVFEHVANEVFNPAGIGECNFVALWYVAQDGGENQKRTTIARQIYEYVQ